MGKFMTREKFGEMPEFNSGIDYLQRIGRIISAAHVTAADRDGRGLLDLCVQLLTEIRPRLNKEEYEAYNKVEKKLFSLSLRKPDGVELFRDSSIFFRSLNNTVHTKGLGMRDAQAGSDVYG